MRRDSRERDQVGDLQTDPAATFRQLYAESYRSLVAYARRRTSNAEEAADVVAETFLVAWQRVEIIPHHDRALPWLYGVARNVIANHRRADSRRERLGERLRLQLLPVAPESFDVEATLLTRQALALLSEPDREVLALSAWEELSPAEIAVALGCSPGTARVRLLRARRRFAHRFNELSEASAPSFPPPPRSPAGDCMVGSEVDHG